MSKYYKIDEKTFQKLRDALEYVSDSLGDVESIINNDFIEAVKIPAEGYRTLQQRVESFTMTVRDWELFSSMDGVETVAEALNGAFKALVKADRFSPRELRDLMYAIMDDYINYGARDTEPETNLCDFINRLHPDEPNIGRWD